MYLFDTDILSNLVKKRPPPYLIERLRVIPQEKQYISSITIGEIVYGAFESDQREKYLTQLKDKLIPFVRLIPFDKKETFAYGEIRSILEKSGTPLNDTDLMIVATAVANNLVLITGNEKHFSVIKNLQVENCLKN